MVSMYMSKLRQIIKRMILFQGGLLGQEQAQAFMRFAIVTVCVVYAYAIYFWHISPAPVPVELIILVGYLAFALGHIVISFHVSKYSPVRTLAANIGDVVMISVLMISLDKYGVPFLGLYLWTTLANGLRFGVLPLVNSAVISLIGFAIVVANTEIWQHQAVFGYAAFLMMLVLPAHNAVLLGILHKARLSAEKANRAKSEFFARMSHDLRTPMNGITTATEILRRNRGLSAEHRELLNLIQDSADVSLRQINNVLDFAKLETGRLTLNPQPFELRQLIANSVRMVANTAHEKKLRLLVVISPETPNYLVGDLHHLRMILMNLLANAVKFTETGYVAVKVECVDQQLDNATLRISVHDTGIGISSDALMHIWDNFRQENEHIGRRYGGTGLGTTIAKQLVELMGGSISATSVKGRGSRFWFEVTLAHHTLKMDDNIIRPVFRVLLLADDAQLLQFLRTAITPAEATIFAVDSAEDTYAAFARAARFGRSWNLVLIDDVFVRRHGGQHCEAIFMEAAAGMETSIYLLANVAYTDHELWGRGYDGALRRDSHPPPISALAINTASLDTNAETDTRVVRIAPWVWRGVRKSMPRILIADDNYTNRKVITMVLESAGYAVDAAADGESALQKLIVGEYKVAVLDLHMPEMDGAEVMRQYAALFPGKTRPVVMLSSDTTEASKTAATHAGVKIYLTKPVKSDVLVATIARLIQEHDVVSLTLSGEEGIGQGRKSPIVLDMDVLADLELICKDMKELSDVIKSFETEADSMILRIEKAVCTNRYVQLSESAQALKGIAANVGAVQLVEACDRILNLSPRETGVATTAVLVQALRDIYIISRDALYKLIYPSESLNS